jgi:hypothetical protein
MERRATRHIAEATLGQHERLPAGGYLKQPEHHAWRVRPLVFAPLGKLCVQRRHGAFGRRRQQMPVHLMGNVDVPMPKEVGKLGDLHPTREHRGSESVA